MKICFLTQNLYTLGGVQKVVTTILNYLAEKSEYEIHIIMPYEDVEEKCFDISEQIKVIDLKTIALPQKKNIYDKLKTINKRIKILDNKIFSRILYKNYYPKSYLDLITNYINEKNYDIVVGVGDIYTLLVGLIADKINSKTIGWMHSTFKGYYQTRGHASYGLKTLNSICMKKIDKVCVLTNKDKEKFDSEFDIDCEVLNNPVNIMDFTQSIKKQNELLFVGRLNKKVKGLSYLIKIVKIVIDKKPEFKLVIVGEGKGRKYLENQISKYKLEKNIDIVGYKKDVFKYYSKSKILISTSRWEGFGMSIVEAMSFGVPCISFENYGPNEIIKTGVNGFLIEKFNVKKFADIIIECIENEEQYIKLSKNAYNRSKDFRLEKIIFKFRSIIDSI